MNSSVYRVVIAGELGPRFANAFEGMELVVADGQTEIKGVIADRAQLRALLNHVDDLGLTLISVSLEGTSEAEIDEARSAEASR